MRTANHLVIACLATGCASQAGPGYQGTPLLELEGTIVDVQGQAQPQDQTAALCWINNVDQPPYVLWTQVPVEGHFPSSFTLDVYTPPPDHILFPWLETAQKISMAHPCVVQQSSGQIDRSNDYLIVYVPEAATADSPIGLFYGPLQPGYHLFVEDWNPSTDQLAQCIQEWEAPPWSCTPAFARSECRLGPPNPPATNTPQSESPPDTPLTIDVDVPNCH
jgi:hypothetical protein